MSLQLERLRQNYTKESQKRAAKSGKSWHNTKGHKKVIKLTQRENKALIYTTRLERHKYTGTAPLNPSSSKSLGELFKLN